MEYPWILLLPILMLLDYFLTIIAASLHEKTLSRHIKIENYELNPKWQKEVNEKKWFNPRHIFSVFIITACLVFLAEFGIAKYAYVIFLMGLLFGSYGAVIGVHLSNILIFLYAKKHPEEVSGTLLFDNKFMLFQSMTVYLVALMPFLLLGITTRSLFVFGAIFGIAFIMITHYIWIKTDDNLKTPEKNEEK
jgi:xanthine/uracil permease